MKNKDYLTISINKKTINNLIIFVFILFILSLFIYMFYSTIMHISRQDYNNGYTKGKIEGYDNLFNAMNEKLIIYDDITISNSSNDKINIQKYKNPCEKRPDYCDWNYTTGSLYTSFTYNDYNESIWRLK